MREWCEIAARAHRATARDLGQQIRLQEREQPIDEQRTHAGVPLGERVRPQQQHPAHRGVRQRLPHPGGVRQHQPLLQRLEIGVGDADVGEIAEARVDPVDRLPRSHRALDDLPRRRHAHSRSGSQHDAFLTGDDGSELLQRK